MAVLVVNCGSTSVKAVVIDPISGERFSQLSIQRIGTADTTASLNHEANQACPASHEDAIAAWLPKLIDSLPADVEVVSVGHRVVHGGRIFDGPTLLDETAIAAIRSLTELAPLHAPVNLAGIEAAKSCFPELPHIAVFDTAFHRTLPRRARTYALPQSLADQHDLLRFGFHGTSHQFVAHRAADYLAKNLRDLRLVTCHLGGGCSVCAVEFGRSVDTSMGMTPLEGLVMGTRSGDLDPGVILRLMRSGMSADELDQLLNRESGLAGLSGIGNDFRDIEQAAEEGNEDCRLALQVFCHRVRKYIGGYAAVMGGLDAIVFTAGIGQNSAVARHRIAQRLEFLGGTLDEELNRLAHVDDEHPVVEISSPQSSVKILVAATDEAWAIAQRCNPDRCQQLNISLAPSQQSKVANPKPIDRTIPVAISARHVHLTQETVERLFGAGHQLTPLRPLSQPGQFAAQEEVTLVGPKREIHGVRVLGPTRSVDQVEISRTDEFFLGIDAPIRASGDVANSPGIKLIGSEGRNVALDHGVICAWRHIHMTPQDAESFSVQDRDVVEVEVGKPGVRSLTFGDVLVRVKPTYKLEMHIDTDEGNAAELDRHDVGDLELTDVHAKLRINR